MGFSETLRDQSDEIFEGIFSHPFITGIAKGSVPPSALIHYVRAGGEYLNEFNHLCEQTLSKCSQLKNMAFCQRQTGFSLCDEIHPHLSFCRMAGVKYENMQGSIIPPTAHHYITHLTNIAQNGNMGEAVAALLPCPWTRLEIGMRIMGRVKPAPDHPFYDWIRFYADLEVAAMISNLRDILDLWAETASDIDKQKAGNAFLKSAQLEYMFWDMAYRGENWPFAEKEQEVQL